MSPDEWLAALQEAIRGFEESRDVGAPVIRLTLHDGEDFYLQSAKVGPGPFVTLSPYPPNRLEGMVEVNGRRETPRVVVVLPGLIAKIELGVEAPEQQGLGFAARAAD